LHTPKLSENETVRQLMKFLFENLLTFVEHFMGFAMLPKLTKFGLHYDSKKDEAKTPRWTLVPIELLKKYEAEAKPMGT
jgi:hypothetical protein